MSTQLYDRYEAGDSMLSKDGEVVIRAARYIIKDLLHRMEADFENHIDLRDFQSVLHSAVDDVFLTEIVDRRLTSKGAQAVLGHGPDEITDGSLHAANLKDLKIELKL